MSKRERDKAGYLLPDVIDPDDCICVCVPIPNDPGHIRAFLGQLDYLGYWWTWEREQTKSGTLAAQVWRGVAECVRSRLDNDCGCGGSSQPTIPPQYRYNENGQVEVSFDGGETWEDGSDYDERQLVVLNRPLPEGLTDPECVGASNITRETKKLVDEIFTQINNGQTAVNIAPGIIALLIALGLPSGGLTLFLVVVYGLIAAVFSAVDAGLEGSFDSSFWDDYTCFWFCELGEDLEVSQSMIDAVFAKVKDRLGGNVISSSVIGNVFESMGNKMLTNAARSGTFTTFDCSNCQCGDLNCGFISTPTENKFVWTEATEKIDPATFTGAINFQQSASGNVMFGSSGATLAAYHEFEEACYITTVELYTSGRPNSSSVTVGYRVTPGGAWINVGTQSFPSWNAGVPKTFTINAPVYAIQVQSLNGNVANNNFTSIVVGDPTP